MREEAIDLSVFYRQRHEREDPEKRRERQREHTAIQRRKEGRPVIGARKKQKLNAGDRVATEPIARFLEQEIDRRESEGQVGQMVIAERTGIAMRRLYGIIRREDAQVSLRIVDKLLANLGLPHMLPILYPEDQ